MEILTQLSGLLTSFVDLMLHLDQYLIQLLDQCGPWLYLILFLVIFCETGLVVTPFLPGDSLLFMVGALTAGSSGLDKAVLIPLLISAAILGDALNYAIGKYFGCRMSRWSHSRFFNRRALEKTHQFYARHGGKTIVIARFMPIIRTFAPFVAGVAQMRYRHFAVFNMFGALIWVTPLVMLGYWFGDLPVVKKNLTLVILGIIVLSLLPLLLAWAKEKYASSRSAV